MVIKEIPEHSPSYWEMLWDNYPEVRYKMLQLSWDTRWAKTPLSSQKIAVEHRRYNIGHPFYYFDMDVVKEKATCCSEHRSCGACWERPWQGEGFNEFK